MKMTNKQCIVIIPVYRPLTSQETAFIKQGIKMTEGFRKIFVAPKSFEPDDSFTAFSDVEFERFSNHYFNSIHGYNQLMLSLEFYTRFQEYEYILIHQADVYLFKPELAYWCNKGFDYIGAPWLEPEKKFKNKWRRLLFETVQSLFYHKTDHCLQFEQVGNGGLSLRKTSSFISVLSTVSKLPFYFYKHFLIDSFNEDLFWGIYAKRVKPDFLVPFWKEALTFAIETKPRFAYELMGKQLPFGCHAVSKHDALFLSEHTNI